MSHYRILADAYDDAKDKALLAVAVYEREAEHHAYGFVSDEELSEVRKSRDAASAAFIEAGVALDTFVNGNPADIEL